MSGGSLDYVYFKVDEAADAIECRSDKPFHKAFAKHLRKVSKALHDIEWVFSGDYSEGDEKASIETIINPKDILLEAADMAMKAKNDLEEALVNTENFLRKK